ncbi:hypothetical protein ANO11243_020390 [Dothideomycetidae sp. 11243]|nr:hypothetical protein ANO11243_020390 [fungal sp. No.11243]
MPCQDFGCFVKSRKSSETDSFTPFERRHPVILPVYDRMMPSRGLQVGARAIRSPPSQLRHASRKVGPFSLRLHAFTHIEQFSSRPTRPLIFNLTDQSHTFRLSQAQRRNLSWNPINWVNGSSAPAQPVVGREGLSTSTPSPAMAAEVPNASVAAQQMHASNAAEARPVTIDSLANSSASAPVDVNLEPLSTFQPAVEEHIGYLHSLGLDYGYGPTSLVQWLLEHIHVYSGMPWWGSLVVTSVFIRVCFIPLTIKMSDSQARMAHIKPLLDPLNKKLSETLRNKDPIAMAETRKEMNLIRTRSGFSLKWMGAAMAGNMVFAYCSFKLLRAMAALPVPGFIDGGALWFRDLTLADPYYLIPGLMAAGFHLTVRYGTETAGADPYAGQPGMKSLMMYVFPAVIWVSMSWFSAALTIWMAAGGLVSIAVGRMLLNPSMRERLGIIPMPSKAAQQMSSPLASMFREDPETASASASSATSRVLDVKGVRSTPGSPQGMSYQAPRVNNSKFSTASPSSFSKTETIVPPRAADIARDAPSPPSEAKKSGLERYTDWASARVNDLGEGYALIGRKLSGAVKKAREVQGTSDDVPDSKTKSKDYLKRAKEYERRYEEGKKRGWR